MQTDASRLWLSRIVTFTMAGLAAASAAYWGLKAWGPSPVAAPALALAWAPPVGPKALALALGGGLAPQAPGAAPPAPSRYALLGVAAGNAQGGAALISVDGQPARPVRVGAAVEGALVLQSVTGRRAVLSSGDGAGLTLELPPLPD
jgi:general secretion pathway protein C